ncbi:MAG: LapA family protein [Actinobacteria bacterium]|nr:LapA family protein [Actinomycetota bacterium]
MRPEEEQRQGDREVEEDEATRLDREHLQRLRRSRQARVVKLSVALFFVVVFAVFVIGNSEKANVDFVFVESAVPLIWVMLACAIVGGIVGFVIGRPGRQFRFHREDEDRRR